MIAEECHQCLMAGVLQFSSGSLALVVGLYIPPRSSPNAPGCYGELLDLVAEMV